KSLNLMTDVCQSSGEPALHLDLSFESCSHGSCPVGYLGCLDKELMAPGFLQHVSQAGAEVYFTGVGMGESAVTCLDSRTDSQALSQLWQQAFPLAARAPKGWQQQAICRFQPSVSSPPKQLLLRVPMPSLLPESMVSQAVYWM